MMLAGSWPVNPYQSIDTTVLVIPDHSPEGGHSSFNFEQRPLAEAALRRIGSSCTAICEPISAAIR
jgi:hypothetical protein